MLGVTKAVLQLLWLLALGYSSATAFHPAPSRRGILLWQVQLSPDQCGSPEWTPCYNVYSVNETHGDLVWFAFTTSSSAVKGMFLGHHSVYYTTWSGPGLYSINAANGHVRWQFPLDNWFRYWVKDIDLGRTASFDVSDEVRDVVYATAAGPPARLYGLRTKSGAKQWEYKLTPASAVLADLAGPMEGSKGCSTLFMAVNQPSSNSSWVQALSTATGSLSWQSALMNDTQLDRLELQDADGILLATTAAADAIVALDADTGSLLWTREGSFCRSPSPIADVSKRRVLLAQDCDSLARLTAVDLDTGRDLWEGWSAPSAAQPAGNCSSFSQADGSILFGCSCSVKARWHWDAAAEDSLADSSGIFSSSSSGSKKTGNNEEGTNQPAASAAAAAPSGPARAAAAADGLLGAPHAVTTGVCLYALNSRNGRLRWVLPMASNATFPAGSQEWGMAPLVRGNLALFFATDRAIAVDLTSGKLRWALQLPWSEELQAYELPVVDAGSDTLLMSARVQDSRKTAVSAVSLRDGKLLWHRVVNGTAQHALEPRDGTQQLMVTGGRVYVEACRDSRCCLRALNVTTGKQRWGMCLDAVQGDDATHPHAQFAIWFITLLTICSIALLVLGASLVYIQRWTEERRILYGTAAPSSPRHSYQPLPPRQSDSEDG